MPRGAVQRVQDSVHGLMEFRGLETVVIEILRTPELQRLRRIRQMGLGNLVFPGAEHSRLVHALGASHLAIRFGRRLAEDSREVLSELLRPDPDAIRDLAVAALCHDIGHGPLSHAWEREVIGGKTYDHSAWRTALGLELSAGAKPAWHELVGQGLLAWPDGELHRLLEHYSAGFSVRISELLRGNYFLPYFPPLLEGDVDVDRADFLLRDSHNCGVRYGRYDIDWLISTLQIGFNESGALVPGFDRQKAPRVVEQFLVARAAMYETVYYHKTVRSVEGMVGLLLRRLRSLDPERLTVLLDAGSIFRPFVEALSGEPLEPEKLVTLDDFLLWTLIEHIARLTPDAFDPTACDLAKRIVHRDLFKAVPVSSDRAEAFLLRPDADDKLQAAVAAASPGQPDYYIFRDIAESQVLARGGSHDGYFVAKDRQAEPFRHCSELSHLPQHVRRAVRVFTIREALESVTVAIT